MQTQRAIGDIFSCRNLFKDDPEVCSYGQPIAQEYSLFVEYLQTGFYADILSEWFAVWPKENFFFIKTEDFKKNKVRSISCTCKYITEIFFTHTGMYRSPFGSKSVPRSPLKLTLQNHSSYPISVYIIVKLKERIYYKSMYFMQNYKKPYLHSRHLLVPFSRRRSRPNLKPLYCQIINSTYGFKSTLKLSPNFS